MIANCEPLGLICISTEKCPDITPTPVPLTGVRVAVKIVDLVAEVEVVQTYVNREAQPIEAVYKFPLDEGAAVFHFSAAIEGREIVGEVKEVEQAQKAYQEAIQSGKTAFLLEEKLPDVFKAKIGNLPPGVEAKVTIKYVLELPVVEDGKVRFSLPTTIAPRYIPANDNSDVVQDLKNISYTIDSKYKMEFSAEISMASNIIDITSPSHDLNKTAQGSTGILKTGAEKVRMNEDLVIVITVAEPHKPRVTIEKAEDGSRAVMVSLVPSFKLREQKTELVFLVDRSGSMMGEAITQAKEALLIFLHSLPVDCYFNIVGFGSTFQSLFPTSRKYDDSSLEEAKFHVQQLDANLGGTELFQPLQHVLSQVAIEGYLRQMFVLTDGEVSNTEHVLSLVRRSSHQSRVFALGLGRSASHHLVGGIARLGGGTAVYATVEERLEKKVLGQLKDALHPAITDVKLSWKGMAETVTPLAVQTEKNLLGYGKPIEEPKEEKQLFRQAPSKVPPVFDGSRFIIYALLTDEAALPTGVNVTANTPEGPLSVDLHLSEMKLSSRLVHRLAAKKLIQELTYQEDQETNKPKIVELGVKYNLASKFTAFVAIDPKDRKETEGGWAAMISREVPLDLASGWHGGMLGRRMMMAPQPMLGQPVAVACFAAPPMAGFGYGAPMAAFGGVAPMAAFGGVAPMAAFGGVAPMASFGGVAPMAAFGGAPEMAMSRNAKICSRGFAPAAEPELAVDIDSSVSSVQTDSPMCFKPAQVPEKVVSKLVQLIGLQKFDGSFLLDQVLCDVVGVALEDVNKLAATPGLDGKVVATALAVSYFEKKLQDEHESWDLVVQKAKKYLQSQTGKPVEELLKSVGSLVEE